MWLTVLWQGLPLNGGGGYQSAWETQGNEDLAGQVCSLPQGRNVVP
jgi:hypothetical protein